MLMAQTKFSMAVFPINSLAELNGQGVKYLLYWENAPLIQSLQV